MLGSNWICYWFSLLVFATKPVETLVVRVFRHKGLGENGIRFLSSEKDSENVGVGEDNRAGAS